MRRALAALFAICALALAGPASAEAGWVADDLDKAFQRWGYSDALCFDAGYGAYPAVRREDLGPNVAAYADDKKCEVVFNSRFKFGPLRRCHVLVHEVGHLAGWRANPGDEFRWPRPDGTYYLDANHSRRQRHVMWPFVVGANLHWRCRAAYRGDRTTDEEFMESGEAGAASVRRGPRI